MKSSTAKSPEWKHKAKVAAAVLEKRRQLSLVKNSRNTIIGFVHPEHGHTHSIQKSGNHWNVTTEEPDVYLAAKLERVVKSNKRFIIIIGGRGSGKSVGVADIGLIKAKDEGIKTYCLREYQSSIKNSVQSLLTEETKRLEFEGFVAQGSSLLYNGEEMFQFAGLARNVDSIKSAHGFGCYQIEESQFISHSSLTALTPTARNKPNKGLPKAKAEKEIDIFNKVSMFFIANPMSSADPFSVRFIAPFKKEIDRDGYYEDDLHLIVKMNYTDNPWYDESGLEEERQFDAKNKSTEEYEWIWLGEFNDEVEGALIPADWFDACIDAHLKKGFDPIGAKYAAHDPSDLGPDDKAYAMRHGSVVLKIDIKTDGDVNEGCDWATGKAIQDGVDHFCWDGDGMGAPLTRNVAAAFQGMRIEADMFKGSEGVDYPDNIYSPTEKHPIKNQKKNKDAFRNKRAQYYNQLRDRMFNTYQAVVHGKYCDPDEMLSLSSDIECLSQLRSEVCRMPVKPNSNGLIELYTKPEMKTKFKLPSPNAADALMMLMRSQITTAPQPFKINPIKPMGRR